MNSFLDFFVHCFKMCRMRIEQNLIYRKTIVPWYDSEAGCIILLVAMGLILLFAISGIYVSHETVEYKTYGWVAKLLTMLSGWVMVCSGCRLIKRYIHRYSK
jgi:hypothetical protein